MSKKILVTGGLGFIGSHTVVELLNAGYEPIIVDNLHNSELKVLDNLTILTGKKIPFYQLDLCQTDAMQTIINEEKNINGIIHFAALKSVNESVNFPLQYYKNNISSLLNVLEACQTYNIQNFVFSSSCTVYGQPEKLPVNELTEYGNIASPYGNTKKIGEEILKDFAQISGKIKVISLRYFNPVGAHSSGLIGELPKGVPSNLVPFITQTAIGKRAELKVFGDDYNTPDGSCIRDFIHVVDLAKAHVKSINYLENLNQNTSFYDDFNVGTGRGTSVLELINCFEEVNQVKLNYKIVGRREGDIENIYAETHKISNVLGWKSELSVSDALKDAWNWEMKL